MDTDKRFSCRCLVKPLITPIFVTPIPMSKTANRLPLIFIFKSFHLLVGSRNNVQKVLRLRRRRWRQLRRRACGHRRVCNQSPQSKGARWELSIQIRYKMSAQRVVCGIFCRPGVPRRCLPRHSRRDLRFSFSNCYVFFFGELGTRSASVTITYSYSVNYFS